MGEGKGLRKDERGRGRRELSVEGIKRKRGWEEGVMW